MGRHSSLSGLMTDTHHLSRSAYERLQAELEDLTTRGRVEIARKIETARELGDLSENGDYHAAKEEQGKMEGRIRHIQVLLERAEIVEEVGGGEVRAGSVVEISDVRRGLDTGTSGASTTASERASTCGRFSS